MGAIDLGVVRQRGQSLKAVPHLGGRAFKQATTAEGKQRVANKGRVISRIEIGDVTKRVSARLDHLELGLAQHHHIAARDFAVHRRQFLHLGGTNDLATRRRLNLCIPARMVGMPMSVEDQSQFPSGLLQLGQNRGGVWRVDTSGQARRIVANQEAVIVG